MKVLGKAENQLIIEQINNIRNGTVFKTRCPDE